MKQDTTKDVAPCFSSVKTEKHDGNNTKVLSLRTNEVSALIDAEATQQAELNRLLRIRAAERRHQNPIIEVA